MGRVVRVLGIDPGLTGAICLYDPVNAEAEVYDMPTLVVGKFRYVDPPGVASLVLQLRPDRATMESVGAAPGQGVVSMFNFGVGVGVLRGVLAANHVPVKLITPGTWRRKVGLGRGDDKNVSRSRAMQLWPGVGTDFIRKQDHGRAEAFLIAYADATPGANCAATI